MIIQKINLAAREIIIDQFKKGLKTMADLGKEYGVDRATIYHIIHNGLTDKEISLIKKKRSLDKQYNRRAPKK